MAHGRIKCLCVLFKPNGAFSIFGCPQVELRNQAINLELLCGRDGINLIEQVTLAQTPEKKSLVADQFLLKQYQKAKDRPFNIDGVLELILASRGKLKIRSLCDCLNVNIKTLERKFKNVLGLSPKEFAAIIRMNHAYRLMKTKTHRDIQDIVFECGYYDQSHLINDFRHFTKFTPDVLWKKPDDHVIYLNRIYTY